MADMNVIIVIMVHILLVPGNRENGVYLQNKRIDIISYIGKCNCNYNYSVSFMSQGRFVAFM